MEYIIKIPVEFKRYVDVIEDGLRTLLKDPQWFPFSLVEHACYARISLTPKAVEYLEQIKKTRKAKGIEDERILQTALMYAKNDRDRPITKYCPFVG
tara:strand:- start:1917 stop:2207 length:291 start_codon:yes stop_codon:yes gene_type:complete